MYIDVIRGRELNVYVSGDMQQPENIMFPVYKQAIQALVGIVQQSQEFNTNCRRNRREFDVLEQERLFRYSSNIIAFSGQRGGGKTSTMLSFSRMIQSIGRERGYNRERDDRGEFKVTFDSLDQEDQKGLSDALKELERATFAVMPPIEPSVLEGKQSILSVVLSRLIEYAESFMRQESQEGGDEEKLDRMQRKLMRDYQDCLSGINGIKYQQDATPQDLTALQNISDGSRLRQSFATFVQDLLELIYDLDRKNTSTYLVLQLDDADSQIDHAYQVLEDVRKYLVIPNMVILMSADMDIFRRLVLERYVSQFPSLGRQNGEGELLWRDLRRMSSKYLDKLIPSIQLVTLPPLDELVLQKGDSLKLRYLERPDSENYVFRWAQHADLGLQDFLLTAIYQKTGVIFVAHTAYVNNIVPTTMRGMMHMLYMLSTMEDIPKHAKDGRLTPMGLKKLVRKQLPIAEENLTRFTRYFREDWLYARITNREDLTFLRSLSSAARSIQVQLTVDYLLKRYKDSLPSDFGYREMETSDKNSLILLEEFMAALHLIHRTQEDFSLAFAIHTLFTLGNHRAIWKQKRKEIERNQGASGALVVFDYAPEETYLPDTYRISEAATRFETGSDRFYLAFKCENCDIESAQEKIHEGLEDEWLRHKRLEFLMRCMVKTARPGKSRPWKFNFMNFISVLLRMSEVQSVMKEEVPEKVEKIGYGRTQQYRLYEMQERALCIAANWDVQDHLFKFVRDRLPEKLPHDTADGLRKIDRKMGRNEGGEQISLDEIGLKKKLSEVNEIASFEGRSHSNKGDIQIESIGSILSFAYDMIDKELMEINSGMLLRDLSSDFGTSFKKDKVYNQFNGIGQSFKYAGKGAIIAGIDCTYYLSKIVYYYSRLG